MQVSQEASKMVWYSDLIESFPQFVIIHVVKGFQFNSVQSLSRVRLLATP